ncbi:MAG TPA: ABC transporter ATP-binding protein [Dehalococcoidia bacterium]|nr:ABC transporter ATP-binding protein [Dehalococcoidia bacterium]
MIRLCNIVKSFPMGTGELNILQGVDMEVGQGEMVAIMGPSGSGKTTLLNIIGCLDVPTDGDYFLDGKEVSKMNRHELARIRGEKIGFVFQTFNLLPYMTALANIQLGLRYAHKTDYAPAVEALTRVGLAERARHKPNELSGGEKQRVAIARALVKNPPLILADEPTGNLDSRSGEEVMSIITRLNKENGITLIVITHDPRIADYCQRVIHIMDGVITKDEKR